MIKKLFAALVMLVCMGSAANAQTTPSLYTVNGCVKEETSGESIIYANVALLNDGKVAGGGVTMENGCFSIKVPQGQYILSVSYMGYKTMEKTLEVRENTDAGVLNLTKDSSVLSDVVITPSLTQRKGDRMVVHLASSPLVEGKNIREVLNYTPGVYMDHQGTLSINGQNNVRVMINDRDVKMSGEELLTYLESINASDILKVEIIPMAGAEYEADSAGGVIHITLKKKALEGVNATIGMNYTQKTYSHYAPYFNAAWRKDRLSLNARYSYNNYGRYNYLGEWTDYTSTGTHHDTQADLKGRTYSHFASVEAVYDLTSRSEAGVAVEYGKNSSHDRTDGETFQTSPAGNMYIPNYYTEDSSYERVNLTAYYRIKTDTLGSALKVMADYTNNTQGSLVMSSAQYMQGADMLYDNVYGYDSPTDIDLVSVRADFDKKTQSAVSWSAGGKYSVSNIDSRADYRTAVQGEWKDEDQRDNVFDYKEKVSALYAKLNASLPHGWNAALGLRMEYTQLETYSLTMEQKDTQDYMDFFPQVSLMKTLGEKKNHSLSINYTRRLSRPSYSIYNPYIYPFSEFSSVVGNPDIKPSYINRYQFTGVLYGKYSITAMYDVQRNSVGQMVFSDPSSPDRSIYQHVNMGSTYTYALSFYAPVKITKWYGVNINCFGYYRQEGYDDRTSYNTAFNASIQNNFSWGKGWNSNLSFWSATTQKQANMVVDPMWEMSFNMTKKCMDGRMIFSLTVNDIFNTMKNVIYSADDAFDKKTISRWDARSVTLGVKWNIVKGKKSKTKTVDSGSTEQRDRL